MNIIIIGATSGIGKALFEKYATDGNRIGIVGRRTHLLEELRKQHPFHTYTATADITKRAEAEHAIYSLSTRNLKTLILQSYVLVQVKSIPHSITMWIFRRSTPMLLAGLSSLTHSTTFLSSKDMVILLPSPRLVDYVANQWHQHIVRRKPTRLTTWKPYERKRSRLAVTSPLPMSGLVS